MATVVAGGLESLQRYPFIINYVNVVSAFRHNEESVRRLLYAAERNLPSIYLPNNGRGTSAPMTVAGAMALGNAGQLSEPERQALADACDDEDPTVRHAARHSAKRSRS